MTTQTTHAAQAPISPPAGGAPALRVERLVKHFGGRRVLDGPSFALEPGTLTALLGPNGAGKTTLFQVLTGLYACDGGEIEIAGHRLRRPADWPAALAEIGVVFQQSAIDLDLDARANLAFHAALHGLPRAAARQSIDALLARMQLTERAHDPVRALSGGMRRKVELARALLTRPRLLLMDEATVGLDPASRRQLVDDVVAGCRSDGHAVLWATHLTDEAAHADRLLVMHRGRIVFDGTPSALLGHRGMPTLEAAFLSLVESPATAGR